MGTRLWTRFYKRASAEAHSRKLIDVLYQQWDGYPDGVGRDLTALIMSLPVTATAKDILDAYCEQLSSDPHPRHFIESKDVLDDPSTRMGLMGEKAAATLLPSSK